MTIKLSFYNRTHTTEDMRPLYEIFKEKYPGNFEKWKIVEMDPIDDRELIPYNSKIREFLRSRVEYTRELDFAHAVMDFRKLVNEEIDREL